MIESLQNLKFIYIQIISFFHFSFITIYYISQLLQYPCKIEIKNIMYIALKIYPKTHFA